MPHVVSQMQPRERPQQTSNSKRVMIKNVVSQDDLRLSTSPRRRNANGPTPTLSLLVTPQGAWNFTPGRQHSKQFSPDRMTPISAVDSVFELSSAATNASPNSATSSFIAELEDTSPSAVKLQKVNMDPKSPLSPTRSLHAATAIDAINDFEAENRRLLERAIAAESVAKLLEEQNLDLRRKVNYCLEQHRPKTAPAQRTSQDLRKRKTAYITTTPLSAFNTMMDHVEAEYSPPPINDTPTPLPRRKSSFPSESLVSHQGELTPNRFGPSGFIPSRRPPPIPEGKKVSASKDQSRRRDTLKKDPSTPKTTRFNSRMTKISLSDATLRSKPLPWAPSAIPGMVEIGSTYEDASPKSQLRPKKSFAKFFRKAKKE
ncbi:uncharacterized protein EAF01_001130 [Botrytis porri]|uniref:Uncharacterized protein n=1 Tax=Botrytis porri TaxID=87229 RepID=A0A4Z1KUN4_9HELO|nr:uncharacterized protein EAF01_001130 [Botrytis porri]KAF7912109.1 hypothetical protein EAF01_001130 [Botrytis porri]TGO88228.1 hypothetical protein BPOR_0175g00020 [Botrytis porri]